MTVIQMQMAIQQRHTTVQREVARWRARWLRCALGRLAVGVLACAASTACGTTDEGKLPPDVQDPTILQTPTGALARYRETVAEFPAVFDWVITIGGILTDELTLLPIPPTTFRPYTNLDSRVDPAAFSLKLSNRLHRLRAQAREARGFIGAYAPDSSPALGAHLYAMEGYAELFLADLFCSGIPLSTVEFGGDYTPAAGSSTADVYRHAAALFDSAFTLASDSVRIQHFVAIGWARALLARGQYADAAAAVASVPDNYGYQTVFTFIPPQFSSPPPTTADSGSLFLFASGALSREGAPSMGNLEGGNGLAYRTSNDPRTLAQVRGQDTRGNSLFFPAKYAVNSPVTFTVANGIEARLIEAEAELQSGSSNWLTKLNALRTDGTQNGSGVYNPGSGGVAGLPPLEDPGASLSDAAAAAAARVDLLFRERAFWLYLTGSRQGDLRRLIREYVRAPEAVYPVGFYQGGGGQYGIEVVVPVPVEELDYNPMYTGCFHRNA